MDKTLQQIRVFRIWFCIVFWSVSGRAIAASDLTQQFDFSSSPMTLQPGADPLFLDVDFGESLASFDLFQIHIVSPDVIGPLAYNWGVLHLGPDPVPDCCRSPLPFGVSSYNALVSGGSATNEFTKGAESSAEMIDRAFTTAANDILDGAFRTFIWVLPTCTPGWAYSCGSSGGNPLTVLSASVTLKNAAVSPVPAPGAFLLFGPAVILIAWRARLARHAIQY